MLERDPQLLTRQLGPTTGRSQPIASLPPVLATAAVRRLEIAAWSILGVYLLSWFVGNLAAGHLATEFNTPFQWGGPVTAIVASAWEQRSG